MLPVMHWPGADWRRPNAVLARRLAEFASLLRDLLVNKQPCTNIWTVATVWSSMER